jgi:hypothetical protein
MEAVKIIALSVGAAILYGILQDQVTARVCVEYFSIGHPPVFATDDPTLLAFGWGVLATWWVGLGLGIPLALIARSRSRPKMTARSLIRPIAILMACVGVVAFVAGIAGYFAAKTGSVWLEDPLASRVPADKHIAFLADGFAHAAAYASGFFGAVVVWVWVWMRRRSLGHQPGIDPSGHE